MDKDKGRKFDSKWKGPYLLGRICSSSVSVKLIHLHTGHIKGRYSFDHVKLYMRRQPVGEGEKGRIGMRRVMENRTRDADLVMGTGLVSINGESVGIF